MQRPQDSMPATVKEKPSSPQSEWTSGSVSSDVGSWFLSSAKKEFRAKDSSKEEAYLASKEKRASQTAALAFQKDGHRGKRSQPAGLRGLRKQDTEAKKGPWRKNKKYTPKERKRGWRGHAPGKVHAGSFVLRVCIYFLKAGVLGEVSGEDLNRIFISFSGVSFQGSGLY